MVEINFFFFSVKIFNIETFQLRLCRVEIFVEIVEICQDLLRLSRFVETQSRFVEMQSRFVEKSWRENTKIHALLDRDRDKLSRNAKIFRSRWISRSRSRLFGLDIDVETKSRLTFENRRDYPSRRDWYFFGVEIESRSRPRRDKSRPPGLDKTVCKIRLFYIFWCASFGYLNFQIFFNVIASKSLTSIQYTVSRFEPTTSWSWAICLNH
jgi:hypothetical protein